MKITAQDLLRMNVVDVIVSEPPGGAHRAPDKAIQAAGEAIARAFQDLAGLDAAAIRNARAEKFLAIGRRLGA